MRRTTVRARVAGGLLVAGLLTILGGSGLSAAEVHHFDLSSLDDFLKGTFDGVAIGPQGTLRLADRVERVAEVDEPFLFSAAATADGWVVGTGNSGRVLAIRRDGAVDTLFTAAEPEIFAVWVDPDGAVYVGSSPNGKVYRLEAGKAEPFFDPHETYIWGIARARDGGLLVATGTAGKLYTVDRKGRGRVLYDSADTHIRSIAALPDGNVLLGTAGDGLVLRLHPDGSAETLYDADQPEVVAFATAPDGQVYAAAVASEASVLENLPSLPGQKPQAGEEQAKAGEEEPVAEITVHAEQPEGKPLERAFGRPPGFKGPRSVVLRIAPSGVAEVVGAFREETVYSLLWDRDRLWVGTGLEGKLYSLADHKMVLEKDLDERQIVALLPDRPGPAIATTNAAALYRMTRGRAATGTYVSPALDAGALADFGALHWDGETPDGASITLAARSGMSSDPDDTWSPWVTGGKDPDVSFSSVPPGRFVQWRAELAAGSTGGPVIHRVTFAYRQKNLAPEIVRFVALDPGQILVPANFNPSNQAYEPAHPNREGIFDTLEPVAEGDTGRLKSLWKYGYQTLRWRADDANDDELVYELEFRSESARDWLPMASDLSADYYSFDAEALPDGIYRFRLTASDRPANEPGEVATAAEISDPVTIDHTPPTRGTVRRQGGALMIEVDDALEPLREAVYSCDAGEWHNAATQDGLLDGRHETLVVHPAKACRLLLLRLTDAGFNVATFDLSGELP